MTQLVKQNTINAEKETVRSIFTDFWFVIPEYQRAYVWDTDNVNDLLDDLWFAYENKNDSEYFLGSLVLKDVQNSNFREFEVLDGQQRLTTLFMLMAVIRDLSNNPKLITAYQNMIYQQENEFGGIPERVRIVYNIRDQVEDFVNSHIRQKDGTSNLKVLSELVQSKNISISNMAKAILSMRDFFSSKDQSELEGFALFLTSKVVLIYVSTDNREDAFRLFTILNNRGIPLTNADILKSINIGEIQDEKDKTKYATIWEKIEESLGDDFDRFLSFIRTILVKEKARVNLLEEFEENIYKKGLLYKGKNTIDFIQNYKNIYDALLRFEKLNIDNDFKNLVTIMQIGLPSGDWIPPLMYYYNEFGTAKLIEFLTKLEYKFSSDWILCI